MSLRELPSIEKLAQELLGSVSLPKPLVVNFTRRCIAEWRNRILNDGDTKVAKEDIIKDVTERLHSFAASRLQPVINATGVLIHTNLGRSPLGKKSADALHTIASGYCNLEFNLENGQRGKRAGYLETSLACLLESEDAIAVNNCAAALVLTLRYFTSGSKKEVIVSRSELVEIGGGFRIPDILETSGAKLVEVGATNKTNLSDYEKAITKNTALILKVHRSNFYIEGFTAEPEVTELSELAHKHDLPLIQDIGSGAVMNTDELAPIEHEPTPQKSIKDGIDLVTFSGDKLLGGPQSGIIAGKAEYVQGIKSEPFFRAVRCDKLILTVLQECIDTYLNALAEKDTSDLPMLHFMRQECNPLRERAETIANQLADITGSVEIVESIGRTGGGTMPKAEIPSIALKVTPQGISVTKFARLLRTGSHAIVGYTVEKSLQFDLRTVFPEQDQLLMQSIKDLLS